jgi:hypothetical protein
MAMARAVNQRVQEEFFGDKVPAKVAASSATTTIDVSVADMAVVTLTANTTIAAPANLSTFQPGMQFAVLLIQDAVGSRTVAWNAAWRNMPAGLAAGGGAATRALVELRYDGVSMQYCGGATAFA